MKEFFSKRLPRRDVFRGSALGFLGSFLPGSAQAAPSKGLTLGSTLYESIGVKPLINARGTFTIISGSTMLPEVRAAMTEAAQHHVHIDEMMAAIGARLAELTQAEFGMVTCGCSAAITHATAACIAGGNPDLHVRLPNLTGFAKDEVIIPRHSRNVYDAAVRAVGAKIVEASTVEELDLAFGPRTAMIYILAGPNAESGPLTTQVICDMAKQRNVPVFVDAAAEILTVPNVHLAKGATLVAYSGGKCIRGPQAAAILLGEKNWLQAAWLNSAPHHAFGRALKVGKEEIMGMLAAVEMWPKRDHKAEWKEWEARLSTIADRARKVDGVTAQIKQPSDDLSNRTPQLVLTWDGTKLGITGSEMRQLLYDTDPRIVAAGGSGGQQSTLSIVPYQMMPGEEKIVGERIYSLLSKPPAMAKTAPNSGTPASVGGKWKVQLDFGRSSATHSLVLQQDAGKLGGTHRGEFYSGPLTGQVAGNAVTFRSSHRVHGTSLGYDFKGSVENGQMKGTVNLGEYGTAQFTARRA